MRDQKKRETLGYASASLSLLLLLPLLLTIATFASASPAQEQWKAFLAKPSARTYAPLSKTIQACVATKCQDAGVSGLEDDFANFSALLNLVERGNHYAMELAFQSRPLYENAGEPSEDLEQSLGLSATLEPTFFLELVQKYDFPVGAFEGLVCQTSPESIDRDDIRREELKRRIQSFSKVKDPRLSQLRDQAISLIQHQIDEYFTPPDDALGK